MKQDNNILINNSVIVVLIIVVLFMSTAYATLSQNLKIEGNATVNANWDVRIINVAPTYFGTAYDSEGKPTFTASTVNFDTNLDNPGDYAIYTITVKNQGNINAKLNLFELITQENGSPLIKYEILNSPEIDAELEPNHTAYFRIKVSYVENKTDEPVTTTKSCTGAIEYVQA